MSMMGQYRFILVKKKKCAILGSNVDNEKLGMCGTQRGLKVISTLHLSYGKLKTAQKSKVFQKLKKKKDFLDMSFDGLMASFILGT